jgi:O-antigen/teichoic acid export membrane protein
MLVMIADFGVGSAIMTLVAHAFASNAKDEPREYFTAALVMACAIALFIGVAGGLAAFCIVPASELPAYLLAIGGVAINVPLGSASSAWLALQKGWMVAVWDLVQTMLFIAGLALAVRYTTDVRLYVVAVYGGLILASALSMGYLLLSHPELRPRHLGASLNRLRTVLRTGLRYFALSALDVISYGLDNIIALQLLGAAASAKMAIVQRVCVAAIGLLMVVAQPLWPAFVDAAARGDQRWMFRALGRGTLLITGAAVAGSGIIVLFGESLLRVWLKVDIGIDRTLLWVMALWIVALSLARVQILLLNALGILRFQIVVFSIATAVGFILKFLIATAVTFPVVIMPAVLWRIGRWRRDLAGAEHPRGAR